MMKRLLKLHFLKETLTFLLSLPQNNLEFYDLSSNKKCVFIRFWIVHSQGKQKSIHMPFSFECNGGKIQECATL